MKLKRILILIYTIMFSLAQIGKISPVNIINPQQGNNIKPVDISNQNQTNNVKPDNIPSKNPNTALKPDNKVNPKQSTVKPILTQVEIKRKVNEYQNKLIGLNSKLKKVKSSLKDFKKRNSFNTDNTTNNLIDITIHNYIEYVKKNLKEKGLYNDFIILSYDDNVKNSEILEKKKNIEQIITNCFKIFTEVLMKLFQNDHSNEKLNTVIINILKKTIKKFNILLLKEQFDYQQKVLVSNELSQYITKFCDFEDNFKNLECNRDIYSYSLRKFSRKLEKLENKSINPIKKFKIAKIIQKLNNFYWNKNKKIFETKKSVESKHQKILKQIQLNNKKINAITQEKKRITPK